jgi:hypothetical protein
VVGPSIREICIRIPHTQFHLAPSGPSPPPPTTADRLCPQSSPLSLVSSLWRWARSDVSLILQTTMLVNEATAITDSVSTHSTRLSRPPSPTPLLSYTLPRLPYLCGTVIVHDCASVFRLARHVPFYISVSSRTPFTASHPRPPIAVRFVNWLGVVSVAFCSLSFLGLLFFFVRHLLRQQSSPAHWTWMRRL